MELFRLTFHRGKKKSVFLLMVWVTFVVPFYVQSQSVKQADFEHLLKIIQDSLPQGWTANPSMYSYQTPMQGANEILIQSKVMDLEPDFSSNDPLEPIGNCEIFLMMLPKTPIDSLPSLKRNNRKVQQDLPHQWSKDSLQKWNQINASTLSKLDREPTHYNAVYSFRIKCRHVPKDPNNLKQYQAIRAFIDRMMLPY